MGGTENVTLTLPANSSGTVTRAPMPASSTVGTIAVKTTSADDGFFGRLTTVLTKKPNFGARAVACVLMYSALVNDEVDNAEYTITDTTLQDLFLHVCLRLALDMSQQSSAAPHAAGAAATAKCGMRIAAVPVTITRTATGYQAIVKGQSHTPKPLPVRVSCTHTATGLTITEKARKAGVKLSRVTGPKLRVGFLSKSSSSGKLKIALTVR